MSKNHKNLTCLKVLNMRDWTTDYYYWKKKAKSKWIYGGTYFK